MISTSYCGTVSDMDALLCIESTYTWLSIVPIQVASCSTDEAHILQTQTTQGADSELGGSPDRHGRNDFSSVVVPQ